MELSDTGGAMTQNPQDPSSQSSSERPPLADAIRAKLEEHEVDRHLNEIAATLEDAVRSGVSKAGAFAHEHRADIDRLIDKAVSAVDRRTDGKHADKLQQMRGSLERGVDRIVEHGEDGAPDDAAGPVSDVPPSNG
jgi:RNA-splicing ligase RtcB